MRGSCRGICSEYKAKYTPSTGSGRYYNGQKRCQTCDIFIQVEGLRCPCCNQRLRMKPRNSKFKERYREKLEQRPLTVEERTR